MELIKLVMILIEQSFNNDEGGLLKKYCWHISHLKGGIGKNLNEDLVS